MLSMFFKEIACTNKKTASNIVGAALLFEIISTVSGMVIGKMVEAAGEGAVIGGLIVGPVGIALVLLTWALLKTIFEGANSISTIDNNSPDSLVINP